MAEQKRQIPSHIVEKWGSARAFKADKRRLVKHMSRTLEDFERGAAFLPNGATVINRLKYELQMLANEVSIKNWGR